MVPFGILHFWNMGYFQNIELHVQSSSILQLVGLITLKVLRRITSKNHVNDILVRLTLKGPKSPRGTLGILGKLV